jgi:hypothetical protein
MAELVTLASTKVDSSTLQLKTLNGRTYLVGPLVMAKEQVMNELLYTKDELTRGCPGWNGRPATVGHPKVDGKYCSANVPAILEANQIGFIFDSNMDNDKLRAQLWIDVTKLDMFPEVRDAIANGVMLEVSTGLMLDMTADEGMFNNVKYKGKAVNHLPDHLALLPGEVGACSIKDGAGFPRINRMFAGNEVAFSERNRLLRVALTTLYTDTYFYLIELFDDSVVVAKQDKLFAHTYAIDKETGKVSIGVAVEVFQKIDYPPITQLGVNTMTEAEKKSKDEADALVKANADAEAATKVAADEKAKADAELAANAEKARVDAENAEKARIAALPSPEVNEALDFLKSEKAKLVAEILANKTNTFTEVELNEMKFGQLRKIATLATPTHANVDRSGLGGPGGMTANGSVVHDESPYIGA